MAKQKEKKKETRNKVPEKKELMNNCIRIGRKLFTKNMIKGESVYGERLKIIANEEYREWNPKKSKIGAALLKNIPINFNQDSKILYLGASTGTTISHLSDIITKGKIFGVEISPRMLTSLVFLAEKRKNIFPILANANHPEEYTDIATISDFVFEDVSQKNQIEILVKNCKVFLKEEGIAMLSLKTRSIDIKKSPKEIHKETLEELKKHFESVTAINLEPYEKDHYFYVCKGFKG